VAEQVVVVECVAEQVVVVECVAEHVAVVVEFVWIGNQPSTPRHHQEGQPGRQGWPARRVLATRAPTRWLQSPVGWSLF
jgi:hypothetical protein